MSTKKKGISIRAYAKHRGVSHVAVLKAIGAGRITPYKDGSIDQAAADRDWADNTDTTKPLNSITGNPKHRRDDAPQTPKDDNNGTSGTASYAKARAVREQFAAALAKIDYEEKAGKLINAEEARAVVFNASRKLRDSILNIPARLTPVIRSIRDDAEAERIFTIELNRALDEFVASIQL